MSAATWSVNHLAARAIALLDLPAADRRELLDELGLLDGTGRGIAPDDREQYNLTNRFVGFDDEYSQGKLAAKFGEAPPPKDNPNLPVGLRNLPPGPLLKAITKAHDTCGTSAGYSKHRNRNERPCVPCTEARRVYNAARRPGKGRYEAPCGTAAAAARHRRRDEPVDEACRLAASAARAEYKRRARAKGIGEAA